jgi:hypothetical protein
MVSVLTLLVFSYIQQLIRSYRNNNWDQGLLNLGFTETEMMRQDFNSFCQVPEPTSNDLVQQLLADAEVPHPLLGNVHGISDPNVLEASQTLRSMFKRW